MEHHKCAQGKRWDTPGNWVGGVLPTATDSAVINLTSAGTVTTGPTDSVMSLMTNASTTVSVSNGSLSLGAATSSIGGPLSVSGSGTLNLSGTSLIGAGSVTEAGHLTTSNSSSTALSSVAMTAGSMLTVSGVFELKSGATLSLADNSSALINNAETIAVDAGASMTVGATTVVLDDYNGGTYGITVAGTLTATNSTFSPTRPADGTGSGITVLTGGHLEATNTTFAWDAFRLNDGSILNAGDLANDTFQTIVFAPGTDIPLLAGSNLAANKSFEDIDINAGSLNAGTLTLGLMGSASTASLRYVFPSGYEVKSAATLAIANNVRRVHS